MSCPETQSAVEELVNRTERTKKGLKVACVCAVKASCAAKMTCCRLSIRTHVHSVVVVNNVDGGQLSLSDFDGSERSTVIDVNTANSDSGVTMDCLYYNCCRKVSVHWTPVVVRDSCVIYALYK